MKQEEEELEFNKIFEDSQAKINQNNEIVNGLLEQIDKRDNAIYNISKDIELQDQEIERLKEMLEKVRALD